MVDIEFWTKVAIYSASFMMIIEAIVIFFSMSGNIAVSIPESCLYAYSFLCLMRVDSSVFSSSPLNATLPGTRSTSSS